MRNPLFFISMMTNCFCCLYVQEVEETESHNTDLSDITRLLIVPPLKIHFILEKIWDKLFLLVLTYIRPSTSLFTCLTLKLNLTRWSALSSWQMASYWNEPMWQESQLRVSQEPPSSSQSIAAMTNHKALPLHVSTQSPSTAMLGTKLPTHKLLRDSLQEPSTSAVIHVVYTTICMQAVNFYTTSLASTPLRKVCILPSCIQLSAAKRGHQTPCVWPYFQKCLAQLTWKRQSH